jgi:hypothetical protein
MLLLCLTKQLFTLTIAQNQKAVFRFCQRAHVLFRFCAKELATGLLAPLTLNLRDHIQLHLDLVEDEVLKATAFDPARTSPSRLWLRKSG